MIRKNNFSIKSAENSTKHFYFAARYLHFTKNTYTTIIFHLHTVLVNFFIFYISLNAKSYIKVNKT